MLQLELNGGDVKCLRTPMWGIYVLRWNAKTPLPLYTRAGLVIIAGHREESNAIAKNLQRAL
jgi:hypothetical protein